MIKFFPSLDLDVFGGDGRSGDDESDTFILQLDLQWQYQTLNSPEVTVVHASHFVVHSSALSSNRSGRSSSTQPSISLSGFPNTFGHVFQHFSHCPQETDPWRIHPKMWHTKNTLERPVDRFMVLSKDLSVIQQVVVEAGWCREPQHRPLHHAREFDVTLQSIQNFCYLLCCGHF